MVLYKSKKKEVWIRKEEFSFQEVYDEVIEEFEMINLIDEYNITTFSDFYDVLIKEYPSKKEDIQSVFKTYYQQHGTREGNVIKY